MRGTIAFGLALTLTAGCSKPATDNNIVAAVPTSAAARAAGDDTIAKSLAAMSGDSNFVEAVKAAGLGPTFAGPGPYTVLVPDDNAFARLPAGKLDRLMKGDQKAKLLRLLTMHVLPGTILSADIAKAIDIRGGSARLITMAGETLTATKNGDKILLSDAAGDKAVITSADAKRSNGVIHQLDTVLSPKSRTTLRAGRSDG